MDTVIQDLRYAGRGVLRSPGFAALTVLCLALGVGINSTVFSIADSVSLRPLPFEQAERLAVLYSTQVPGAGDRSRVSYQDFRDWQAQTRSFAGLAAYSYRSLSITEGVESERFQGSAITWNLFPLLGVHPVVGRQFTSDDDRAGAPPVVMLSHGLWQSRYAADESIVGARADRQRHGPYRDWGDAAPFSVSAGRATLGPGGAARVRRLPSRPHADPVRAGWRRTHRSRRRAVSWPK